MAILSSFSLIRGLSLFHLTLAYFLLFSPSVLVEQTFVLILGEAMHLPQITNFEQPSPTSAFLAILFAFLGFSDLTAISMNEQAAYHYWGSQTPVRLLFLLGLSGYMYITKPDSAAGALSQKYLASHPADNMKNGMVFSWAFLECTVYFMIYLALKEEGKQRRQQRT